tara:strand:- start:5372 stop:6376 length:1005 start_codon:yes stop_codon:yes gene_type:complete
MSNLEHFNLGPVSDVDPDVLTDQILDALGLYIEDDKPTEESSKSLDSLTDLMQKVAEGKLTASAAISITKSAGLYDPDVEDAIIAQSVIGRRAIAKALATEEEEEEDVLRVGLSMRQRLRNQLDLNGDGYVTLEDLLIAVESGDAKTWIELFGEYGGVYDIPDEGEQEEESDPNQNVRDQMDTNGDGIISNQEWRDYRDHMRLIRDGDLPYDPAYDLDGDGDVDNADIDIANDIRNGGNPLRNLEHQKEVDLITDAVLDEKKPEFDEKEGIEIAGLLSQVLGTQFAIVDRVRRAIYAQKNPGTKPGGGAVGLTADAGGGGIVGGSGNQPGGGGG